MIEVKYNSGNVQELLKRIVEGTQSAEPIMKAIGETVMEIAKKSFETSASPDGEAWESNSDVTVLRYLEVTGGNFKKDGTLTTKGQARKLNKKPLIGQSRDLSRQFSYVADADSVTVSNTMVYAAMQQFGGTKTQFPHLWGDVPARPFMPMDTDGKLMPETEAEIIQLMEDYLDDILDQD